MDQVSLISASLIAFAMNSVIYRSVLKELGGFEVIRIDRGVHLHFEIGGPGILVLHLFIFFLGSFVSVQSLQGMMKAAEFTITREIASIQSITTGKPGSSSIALGNPAVADQKSQTMTFIKPANRTKAPPINQ